ncbi:LysR family transcriptional regulator [Pseudonocardia thermophila]|uniref:LysR family transcriptional regulator n=1 Tax=Pseudonocardia thermophila TaxID=1848 RepID=UPI00248D760B|nr:LysR family transcriptional regulator [Pseudonocardia thermophila]
MPPPSAVLDIVALRSLVAVADCGGFHRAAENLSLSQSAVSQHVRRLEKTINRPLVEKVGRSSRFTPDGELLVGEARRILAAHDEALRRIGVGDERASIVLGTTEHAADELLGLVTAALSEALPDSAVRFRLDRSDRLNDAIERGTLDLAMYIGDVRGEDSISAGALPLTWYAAPSWERPPPGEPIPLVVIDSPCTIRRRALETLTEHGLPATVVGEAAYLAGVLNAARAGLGVALVAGTGSAPEGLVRRTDLPPVPPEPLRLRARAGADPRLLRTAAEALEALLVPCAVA